MRAALLDVLCLVQSRVCAVLTAVMSCLTLQR